MPGAWRENVGEDGIWRSLRTDHAGAAPRPGLFLDRDGTVIKEVGYLSRPEEVCPVRDAIATIVRANALGIPVVVVTNQSGIARGIFDWPAYVAVEAAAASKNKIRVVSMPCVEAFDAQSDDYRRRVLPDGVPVAAVEAGGPMSWHRFTGRDGLVIGLTTFGESSPWKDLADHFGLTSDKVLKKLESWLA